MFSPNRHIYISFLFNISGLICVPIIPERLDQLNLPLMVPNNTEKMKTAYTISVDYKYSKFLPACKLEMFKVIY